MIDSEEDLSPVDDLPTYVYFVQAENGLIKIGYTAKHPFERLEGLISMSPITLKMLGVIAAHFHFEKRLHRHFADARQHGEWFLPVPRLLRLINRCAKQPPTLPVIEPREKRKREPRPSYEEIKRREKVAVEERIARSINYSVFGNELGEACLEGKCAAKVATLGGDRQCSRDGRNLFRGYKWCSQHYDRMQGYARI